MDAFTERLAQATVALAVLGSAAALGVMLGAVVAAIWPSTIRILDQALAMLLCLGAAGWWYAAIGRRWTTEDEEYVPPRRLPLDREAGLRFRAV